MDEGLSGWEDRLRHELDASVRDVRAGDDLVVRTREGGRRRLRRRRALVTLPAAVVVAGGAVWAGRQVAPQPVTPAGSPVTAASTPLGVATDPPVLTMEEGAARDVFFGAGYTYDDAVELGGLWGTDPYEAKIRGGQALENGEALPISR
ncbi:hypothetical protein ACFQ46_04075 [Kineococcus sp. GCM10028916]|uniref:hypothetical protein n=1 Tax=Kineococcus sp. GCM10028916 TaxID=3273394 RepID=UPI003637F46E